MKDINTVLIMSGSEADPAELDQDTMLTDLDPASTASHFLDHISGGLDNTSPVNIMDWTECLIALTVFTEEAKLEPETAGIDDTQPSTSGLDLNLTPSASAGGVDRPAFQQSTSVDSSMDFASLDLAATLLNTNYSDMVNSALANSSRPTSVRLYTTSSIASLNTPVVEILPDINTAEIEDSIDLSSQLVNDELISDVQETRVSHDPFYSNSSAGHYTLSLNKLQSDLNSLENTLDRTSSSILTLNERLTLTNISSDALSKSTCDDCHFPCSQTEEDLISIFVHDFPDNSVNVESSSHILTDVSLFEHLHTISHTVRNESSHITNPHSVSTMQISLFADTSRGSSQIDTINQGMSPFSETTAIVDALSGPQNFNTTDSSVIQEYHNYCISLKSRKRHHEEQKTLAKQNPASCSSVKAPKLDSESASGFFSHRQESYRSRSPQHPHTSYFRHPRSILKPRLNIPIQEQSKHTSEYTSESPLHLSVTQQPELPSSSTSLLSPDPDIQSLASSPISSHQFFLSDTMNATLSNHQAFLSDTMNDTLLSPSDVFQCLLSGNTTSVLDYENAASIHTSIDSSSTLSVTESDSMGYTQVIDSQGHNQATGSVGHTQVTDSTWRTDEVASLNPPLVTDKLKLTLRSKLIAKERSPGFSGRFNSLGKGSNQSESLNVGIFRPNREEVPSISSDSKPSSSRGGNSSSGSSTGAVVAQLNVPGTMSGWDRDFLLSPLSMVSESTDVEDDDETDEDDNSDDTESDKAGSPKTASAQTRTQRTKEQDQDKHGGSREEKLTKREKNRLAAMKCRRRKRDKIESLTQQVQKLEQKQDKMKAEVDRLDMEREQLEEMLRLHAFVCPGSSGHQTQK